MTPSNSFTLYPCSCVCILCKSKSMRDKDGGAKNHFNCSKTAYDDGMQHICNPWGVGCAHMGFSITFIVPSFTDNIPVLLFWLPSVTFLTVIFMYLSCLVAQLPWWRNSWEFRNVGFYQKFSNILAQTIIREYVVIPCCYTVLLSMSLALLYIPIFIFTLPVLYCTCYNNIVVCWVMCIYSHTPIPYLAAYILCFFLALSSIYPLI